MNKLLFLLIVFSGSALSCSDYFYGRIAYGLMFNNLNIQEEETHNITFDSATVDFGYKWKISDKWHWDLQYQHNSQYFFGSPFNDAPELTSEQISIGLEYRTH